MEKVIYKTGEICTKDGLYQCQLSRENQHYKKGDTFDFCPQGKKTKWKRIE